MLLSGALLHCILVHFWFALDICTNIKNVKDKILYKIDDIIIIENLKYLNLEEFKEYSIGNEIFYISPTFTLRDIDLFISILKNTNYTNEI